MDPICTDPYPFINRLVGGHGRSNTFVEIDHELISTAILLPSADSRRVVVSYKQKYVHEVLDIHLVKLAQDKKCGYVTDHPDMTIAVGWDVSIKPNKPNGDFVPA